MCPPALPNRQVDLATSSIRPGQPAAWQTALQETLQAAVAESKARISVFTGTWQHDVDQAQLLAHHTNVKIKVGLKFCVNVLPTPLFVVSYYGTQSSNN